MFFCSFGFNFEPTRIKTREMKSIFSRIVLVFLAAVIFLSSCSSTTVIQSIPSGAKLYLNGEPLGYTPVEYTDSKIVGSSNLVKLEKEGFQPLVTSFSKDEEVHIGALIGGIFFLFPFLWLMKYKPTHTYELKPLDND